MVFNKVTVFLVVLGLVAVSAYPTPGAEKKTEVVKTEVVAAEVPTTVSSLSDDVQDAVVTTVASDVLADDAAVTTELSVAVRNEEVPKEPEVIAVVPEVVETKVLTENVIVPAEKTAPVVVAEIVGEKVVPVVEVVEIVPVEQTGPVSYVKSATVPKVATVVVPTL